MIYRGGNSVADLVDGECVYTGRGVHNDYVRLVFRRAQSHRHINLRSLWHRLDIRCAKCCILQSLRNIQETARMQCAYN